MNREAIEVRDLEILALYNTGELSAKQIRIRLGLKDIWTVYRALRKDRRRRRCDNCPFNPSRREGDENAKCAKNS